MEAETLDDPGDAPAWILRRSHDLTIDDTCVDLVVDGYPAIELPGTPGWLTGEPLTDQGIEVDMPNLPADLPLPGVDTRRFRCRAEVVAPGAFRIVIAPDGSRVFDEDATWLGIVTTPRAGTIDARAGSDADGVTLESHGTRLHVGTDPFRITVEDGRTIGRTAERLRQVAGFPMAPAVVAEADRIRLHLELAHDEEILGFGEQFSRLVKNGQELRLHVDDALGTGTGLTYKPVPVWHSTRGYLGFLNTGATVDVGVGHTRPSVLSLAVEDEALDLYLITGSTPAERLSTYTNLTGRARRPPLWAFGSWLGRCRYRSRMEMLDVADELRARDIPADVLHLDPDWMVTDRLNTDFIWNTDRFGDRAAFVSELADRALRLSVWEVPYLDPASPRFADAVEADALLRTADGELAELQGTPTPDGRARALVDVTDAGARRWWQDLHEQFLEDGIAVFKTDFGEGCPPGAQARDGTPSNHLHNLYSLRYNAAVSEVTERTTGRTPLVWGRSGWAGSQRYQGQWGGDAESTVAGLQATLRGGLSYALSAPGLWSHDIGGFFGPELTPGLYVRWTQFGALSPMMRAHGLRPREPWAFGDEALVIAREWTRLRYSLLPYLWEVAGEVETLGLPMMRPLWLEFPDDPMTASIDDQYLLGHDLLVAPVLDDAMRTVRRRLYLPEGRWFELATDVVHDGPGFITVDVPIAEMPVFVRDGARLPRVEIDSTVRSTDDVAGRPWTLHLYGHVAPVMLDGFQGEELEPAAVVFHG